MELRPYQEEARQAIEKEWQQGNRKTLLILPTGTGKTIVFAKVVQDRVKQGDRVLILAHRVSKRKEEKYGHLKENIGMDNADIDGEENGNSVAGFHKKAYVARFLNDGTIKMPATHWVDNTRRAVADKVFEAEHQVLDERAGGK